jgi:hypothetical protein
MLRVALFAVYLFVSFPSSLSLDLGTDAVPETDAAQEPDDSVDDLAFAAEQPGKHPPFEHSDITYSLLSYACIRIAADTVILFLLHSLFIVTCYCYLPAYPKLFSIGWVETHQRPQFIPTAPLDYQKT